MITEAWKKQSIRKITDVSYFLCKTKRIPLNNISFERL